MTIPPPIDRVLRSQNWRWIAAIFAASLALALVQKIGGVPFSREIDVGLRSQGRLRKFGFSDVCYSALIPRKYRTDLVVARGIMLENGTPLKHRKASVGAVTGDVHGAFALTKKYVYFVPRGGGNPNINGNSYALRVPQRVKPGLLWGLFGALLVSCQLALRARPATGPPGPPGPLARCAARFDRARWAEPAIVFLVALVGGALALIRFAHLNDGGLSVLGRPYSDGIGWHQTAVYLRDGLGFTGGYSNNRPFYPIFQAMVFLFTGDSVAAAHGTNVFLIAMGGFFVYAAARELFPRPVAAGALAFVLFAVNHQTMAPTLLTELPAYAFGAAGVFLLARGCSPAPRARRGWLLFLSGVFFGCSNLARPYTAFALPLLGFAIVYSGVALRSHWKTVFLRGSVFGAGVALVIFPWCVHQKLVYDTWGISLQTAEMLYATAATDRGRWGAEIFEEAANDGFTKADPVALNNYFAGKLSAMVRADPAEYLRTLGTHFVEFVHRFEIGTPNALAILALVVLVSLLGAAIAARSALPLLGFPLFLWIGGALGGLPWLEALPPALVVLAIADGRRGRLAALIVAMLIVGTALLNATVGNFAIHRGEPILDWLIFATVCAAAAVLARLWSLEALRIARKFAGRNAPRAEIPAAPPAAPPMTGALGFAHGLCLFMLVSGVGLIVRTVVATPPDSRAIHLSDATRARALAAARAKFPKLAAADAAVLYAEAVSVGDYRWPIPSGVDVGHWSRLFERRGKSRTAVYLISGVRPSPESGLVAAQFRGSLDGIPRKIPFVVVGVRNVDPDPPMDHDRLVIEAVALIPLDPTDGTLAPDAAHWFPPSRQALAAIKTDDHADAAAQPAPP